MTPGSVELYGICLWCALELLLRFQLIGERLKRPGASDCILFRRGKIEKPDCTRPEPVIRLDSAMTHVRLDGHRLAPLKETPCADNSNAAAFGGGLSGRDHLGVFGRRVGRRDVHDTVEPDGDSDHRLGHDGQPRPGVGRKLQEDQARRVGAGRRRRLGRRASPGSSTAFWTSPRRAARWNRRRSSGPRKARRQRSRRSSTSALDALSVYVHKNNPLERDRDRGAGGDLRRERQDREVVAARREECRRAPATTIVRVSRQNNSGTYVYFREAVLGKKREFKLGLDRPERLEGRRRRWSRARRARSATAGWATRRPTSRRSSCREEARASRRWRRASRPPSNKTYPLARRLYFYSPGEPAPRVQEVPRLGAVALTARRS